MSYIMYICPGCRSYFKTGCSGRKIKCRRCNEEFLTDLRITDEEWRKLNPEARQARIGRAIVGEQLRVEISVPDTVTESSALPKSADESSPDEDKESKTARMKEDLPDEVILEAKQILEQQDMQAEMPKQPVDKKRLAVVCGVSGGLLVLLLFLSFIVPLFRMNDETHAINTVQAGDIFSFGRYKGNNEWTVLERDNDGILMVSNFYVANAIPMDPKGQINQIDWLNSSFLNRTFNLYERRKLLPIDDSTGQYINIMSDYAWSEYAEFLEIENDGKVHALCRVSVPE